MVFFISCTGKKKEKNEPLNLGEMIQPVPEYSVLKDTNYNIWGASMVQTDDGRNAKAACHDGGMRGHATQVSYKASELVLLEQNHVAEEGSPAVSKFIQELAKKNGSPIKLEGFVRWTLGGK